MDSLTFTPGRAFLSSDSPSPPWTAVFEDEGPAGYFYACDRSQLTQEHSILDAMLIYNGASLDDREVLPVDEPYAGFDWDTYLKFWELVAQRRATGRHCVDHQPFRDRRGGFRPHCAARQWTDGAEMTTALFVVVAAGSMPEAERVLGYLCGEIMLEQLRRAPTAVLDHRIVILYRPA